MAKISAKGRVEVYRATTDTTRLRAMSDGVVLSQWKYQGRWQPAVVMARRENSYDATTFVKRYTQNHNDKTWTLEEVS